MLTLAALVAWTGLVCWAWDDRYHREFFLLPDPDPEDMPDWAREWLDEWGEV